MKKYGALSILFLFLSLLGGIFLVKSYQSDNYSSPTPTSSISPTPSSTPAPIITPTSIPTITPFASSKPSSEGGLSTPTPTPIPTDTPTITPTIAETIEEIPTPTRIILPQAGIEFPSQITVIIGGIITLFGFLILL